MTRGSISIGCTPLEEGCIGLGAPGYSIYARKECLAFINMLKRKFPGVEYKITSNPHDFGTYLDVEVVFDAGDERAVELAYNIEGNTPEHWDDEARKELGNEYFEVIRKNAENRIRKNKGLPPLEAHYNPFSLDAVLDHKNSR